MPSKTKVIYCSDRKRKGKIPTTSARRGRERVKCYFEMNGGKRRRRRREIKGKTAMFCDLILSMHFLPENVLSCVFQVFLPLRLLPLSFNFLASFSSFQLRITDADEFAAPITTDPHPTMCAQLPHSPAHRNNSNHNNTQLLFG